MYFLGSVSSLSNEPFCWLETAENVTAIDNSNLKLLLKSNTNNFCHLILIPVDNCGLSRDIQSTIRNLVKNGNDVVIVDLSPNKNTENLAMELGVRDYIFTPISRNEFLVRLGQYCNRRFTKPDDNTQPHQVLSENNSGSEIKSGAIPDIGSLIMRMVSSTMRPFDQRAERMKRYAQLVLSRLLTERSFTHAQIMEQSENIARIAIIRKLGGMPALDYINQSTSCILLPGMVSKVANSKLESKFSDTQVRKEINDFYTTAQLTLETLWHAESKHEYLSKKHSENLPLFVQLYILLDTYDNSIFNKKNSYYINSKEEKSPAILARKGFILSRQLVDAFNTVEQEMKFIALQLQQS